MNMSMSLQAKMLEKSLFSDSLNQDYKWMDGIRSA